MSELTGAPAASPTAETPLMEAGVDSLAATELSSRLRSLTACGAVSDDRLRAADASRGRSAPLWLASLCGPPRVGHAGVSNSLRVLSTALHAAAEHAATAGACRGCKSGVRSVPSL